MLGAGILQEGMRKNPLRIAVFRRLHSSAAFVQQAERTAPGQLLWQCSVAPPYVGSIGVDMLGGLLGVVVALALSRIEAKRAARTQALAM